MKRPNGSGGIRKLKGKRRHPYQAVVSIHESGRRKQISLGCYKTKKEALEALAKHSTSGVNLARRDMTFGEIFHIILPQQKPSVQTALKSTVKWYDPIMDKRITDITNQDLNSITSQLTDVSQSTQTNIKIIAKRVYKYALQEDIVLKDRSAFMTFPPAIPAKRKTIVTPEEVEILRPDSLWIIMLYTGMRISEALSVEDEDIYPEDDILCIHVRESKTSAGVRTIPVHSMIMDLVVPYRVRRRSTITAQRDFRALNLPHTSHALRHTFISKLKQAGADEYYIEELVGHRHSTLTERVYMHPTIDKLKETIELFHM